MQELSEAIRRHLDSEGALPCAMAFRVAEELGIVPSNVGQAADDMDVRLSHCQLGLFGYGPKAEGRHKVVQAAAFVETGLAQAIHDGLAGGRLSCAAAWEIAAALNIPKMDVAAAAEMLGVKIARCQLGAF